LNSDKYNMHVTFSAKNASPNRLSDWKKVICSYPRRRIAEISVLPRFIFDAK